MPSSGSDRTPEPYRGRRVLPPDDDRLLLPLDERVLPPPEDRFDPADDLVAGAGLEVLAGAARVPTPLKLEPDERGVDARVEGARVEGVTVRVRVDTVPDRVDDSRPGTARVPELF